MRKSYIYSGLAAGLMLASCSNEPNPDYPRSVDEQPITRDLDSPLMSQPVPEPGSMLLVGTGLVAIALLRRKYGPRNKA